MTLIDLLEMLEKCVEFETEATIRNHEPDICSNSVKSDLIYWEIFFDDMVIEYEGDLSEASDKFNDYLKYSVDEYTFVNKVDVMTSYYHKTDTHIQNNELKIRINLSN